MGSQVDWRWVALEADYSVAPVQRRWAVRAEVGQGGYLVVLADWVDLEVDCWVLPALRRWAVRAEVGRDGYLVVPADWVDLEVDDCWVVPVQRRSAVRAEMAARRVCYRVAPVDWVG